MTNNTTTAYPETAKTMKPATLTSSEISDLVENADDAYLSYHHTEARLFLGSPNMEECEGVMSLSPELESDNFEDYCPEKVAGALRDYAGDIRGIRLLDTKHDGSLRNGLEIASQPASLAYHMRDYNWANILKILSTYSESHDAGTCGLHVHVSRKSLGHTDEARDLVIAKLLYLIEKWFTPDGALGKFSRRDMNCDDDTYWCKTNKIGIKSSDKRKDFDRKYKEYKSTDEYSDRYHALNLTNHSTIEFRMFRGTHNPETFAATLQLVEAMVRFCKTHTTTEVQTCRFGDIVATCKYAELASYCTRRGICLRQTRNA